MVQPRMGSGIYVLRHEAQDDLLGVLERLSGLGYDGVELISLNGHTADQVRKKADTLSLSLPATHTPATQFEQDPRQVIDDHKTLGARYVVLGYPGALATEDPDPAFLARIEQNAQTLRAAGLIPLYHNHDYDVPFLEPMMDACPSIALEPDLGWMVYAGTDPAYFLAKYQDRCPVIHLKDIYADDPSKLKPGAAHSLSDRNPENSGFAFRPTGYGVINIPKLWPLCLKCAPEWLIMDHDDAYTRDIYTDMAMGLHYMRNLMTLHPAP